MVSGDAPALLVAVDVDVAVGADADAAVSVSFLAYVPVLFVFLHCR
jgi:hypothetical protein